MIGRRERNRESGRQGCEIWSSKSKLFGESHQKSIRHAQAKRDNSIGSTLVKVVKCFQVKEYNCSWECSLKGG